jgi:lysophospholipase L1-like esterase
MKKEWLLMLASTLMTVLVALALIRWLAPELLGMPKDLRLVRVSEEVPPFFDNVFRAEDYKSPDFIINDPVSIARAKPLFEDRFNMGPNDVLGFRNRAVPNVADIVTIGDSQTYGNNALLDENWPSRLRELVRPRETPIVYNMSCGAWSGPQYLEILRHAIRFKPKVVVIAFYTGNDPLSAFTAVYGSDQWKDLRLRPDLSGNSAPKVNFPAPRSEWWPVRFSDGSQTIFTPTLRLSSNLRDDPSVQTGWKILGEVVRRAETIFSEAGARLVVTIIPTKEFVHSRRVAEEISTIDPVYQLLVDSETEYLEEFAQKVEARSGVTYVDLTEPLLEAAKVSSLYTAGTDGHPVAAGYEVIARALAPAVRELLPEPPRGLVFVERAGGHSPPILLKGTSYRMFSSQQVFVANGWVPGAKFSVIKPRDLASFSFKGRISTVDPARFGPQSLGATR